MNVIYNLVIVMYIVAILGFLGIIWVLIKEQFSVHKSYTINILQPDGTYKKHTTHSTGWSWNRN